jgi:hypothetical protein
MMTQKVYLNVGFFAAMMLTIFSCDRPTPSPERVKTQDVEAGPVRHDTLTPQQLNRLRTVQATLAEVDASPLEKWIDDFKRDVNPDLEIAIYEAIAHAYQTFCSARPRTPAQKQDAYGLLLERSGTTDDNALRNYKLKALTIVDARELLSYYNKSAEPIQVFRK